MNKDEYDVGSAELEAKKHLCFRSPLRFVLCSFFANERNEQEMILPIYIWYLQNIYEKKRCMRESENESEREREREREKERERSAALLMKP